MGVAVAQKTKVASWGNSEAVRIPKGLLRSAGLASGDEVNVSVNERGNIEIMPEAKAHRRVRAARGVTYESLFDGYTGGAALGEACDWPDVMVGAEKRSWGL